MDDTLPSKNCSGWYPGQKEMVPNGSTRTHGQVWWGGRAFKNSFTKHLFKDVKLRAVDLIADSKREISRL